MQESTETRLTNLEHTLYDMHARLQRSEDNSQFLHVRNQVVMESLSRSLQLNHEMARVLLSLIPNPDTPLYRDGKCIESIVLELGLTRASCQYAGGYSTTRRGYTFHGGAS
jgi:hypothetical protein